MGRIALTLLIILLPYITHAADDFSTRLRELTKKAKEIESTYLTEERKLRSIDKEIPKIQSRMAKVRENIQKKQEQIAALDAQIDDYEADLNALREKMRHQWVLLYKSASLDMVTIYYGHEKYSGYLNAIIRHHVRLLEEYQGLRAGLGYTRKKVNDLTLLLERDLAELQGTVLTLEREHTKKERLVSSLKGKTREYQDEIENLLREIQKREKERKERAKRERAKRERERRARDTKDTTKKEKRGREQEPIVASGGFFQSRGRLPWPVKGRITRGFGSFNVQGVLQRSQGIDIETQEGASVRCVYQGTVVYANWMGKYGNTIILDHGDGFYSIYGHLQELTKSLGQSVSSQDVIARVGQSGNVLKPTLHFEIRFHQKAQDPTHWLGHE